MGAPHRRARNRTGAAADFDADAPGRRCNFIAVDDALQAREGSQACVADRATDQAFATRGGTTTSAGRTAVRGRRNTASAKRCPAP